MQQTDEELATTLRIGDVVRELAQQPVEKPITPETAPKKMLEGAADVALEVALEGEADTRELDPAVQDYIVRKMAGMMVDRWLASDDARKRIREEARKEKNRRRTAAAARKRNRQ